MLRKHTWMTGHEFRGIPLDIRAELLLQSWVFDPDTWHQDYIQWAAHNAGWNIGLHTKYSITKRIVSFEQLCLWSNMIERIVRIPRVQKYFRKNGQQQTW